MHFKRLVTHAWSCRQCVLLAVALAIGQWLEKRKVAWLGEASVALLIGILMGLLSRVFTFSATYVSWMSFQVGICYCCMAHHVREFMLAHGCCVQRLPHERANSGTEEPGSNRISHASRLHSACSATAVSCTAH